MDSAISRAYRLGRGGKGCIIVCASGNTGGGMLYPARNNLTISVGAIRENDSICSYSSYGSELDVVAPSTDTGSIGRDLWSIDQMGANGYNPYYYDCGFGSAYNYAWWCSFGGTSAACPLVSRTAALLLSRRPDLTSAQVYDVIRNSAQTHLQWGSITPPDEKYGYGRADAFRALLAVCRGDSNNDGWLDVSDVMFIVNHLYKGGRTPWPDMLVADPNCDAIVNIPDATYLNNYFYKGGPPLPICFNYGD
jgi:subtilisin family serine protease